MAVSKRTGRKSLAANDFLIPLPPGPPTANDVGTNRPFDNGSAVVEFSPVDLAVSYKVYAAQKSGGTTFSVTNSGTGAYLINGTSNPTLSFTRGHRYILNINSPGHPFWIQTVSGAYSAGNVYNTGITNNGTDNGTIIVEVALDAPQLYYACQFHAPMQGSISVNSVGTIANTGASSPIIVTGLKSNILYAFIATGFNDEGVEGGFSDPSTSTLITTVPATPAAPTASSPNANQDVVNWLAPATGGKTITGYIWAASDGKTNLAGGNPGGGPTTNTSVTVNQEAATAQTYTVYAINANGNSLVSAASNSVTTTFSFAPFGAFGFSPFGAFTFSPFMAFTFSPFGAFSFSPFMAFGFSPFYFYPFGFAPFMAFGFAPFRAFGFAPSCIASKTKISTINDSLEVVLIAAEDLKIGDKLICPIWEEFDGDDYLDYQHEKVFYKQITSLKHKFVWVKDISSKVVTDTIIFNFDSNKHFSKLQPILAKKQGTETFAWEITGTIAPGDVVMQYNPLQEEFEEVLIEDVQILDNIEETVYLITPDDDMTFIAGDIIAC
jgi:hypothetical protein